MRIRILSVNHRADDWLYSAENDYLKRFPSTFQVERIELKPAQKESSEKRLLIEANGLQQKIIPGASTIALDERGNQYGSIEFASFLRKLMESSPAITFMIGSADGLAPELKTQAHYQLSLSRFTLPHLFARLVLIEQLYRAYSLQQGHPYHRT